MVGVCAMAEIKPKNVNAGFEQRVDCFSIATGRP
jgi:hypothetical protein